MDFYPVHEYVNLEFIEPLYVMFEAQASKSVSLQGLFHLMQQSAEEENLLALKYEQLDDFVPLLIVEKFVLSFLKGYKDLFVEVGLGEICEGG